MSDPRSLRFTRPELLRSLAPELLSELLQGFPAFLTAVGLDLGALGANENRFAACRPLIAELLKNGPTTPTPLVEALFIISVLAEPEPTEELWHTLTQAGIPIPPDASLADLALTGPRHRPSALHPARPAALARLRNPRRLHLSKKHPHAGAE
jgi:hypothetical protein